MVANGVILNNIGKHRNTLKMRPPMPFAREHADIVVDTLARCWRNPGAGMTAEAAEAAAHWGGAHSLRLIRDRENAVFEAALPTGRAALRLHRVGYQSEAAIRSELWWCAALADAGVPVPRPLPAQDGACCTG
jgi:hypothetical protein